MPGGRRPNHEADSAGSRREADGAAFATKYTAEDTYVPVCPEPKAARLKLAEIVPSLREGKVVAGAGPGELVDCRCFALLRSRPPVPPHMRRCIELACVRREHRVAEWLLALQRQRQRGVSGSVCARLRAEEAEIDLNSACRVLREAYRRGDLDEMEWVAAHFDFSRIRGEKYPHPYTGAAGKSAKISRGASSPAP